jgi:hypothetical protein
MDRTPDRAARILHLILIGAALAGALAWLGRIYGFPALALRVPPIETQR